VDLTGKLKPGGGYLALRVEDHARRGAQPKGKQSSKPESYGCYYTRTTGVWQTVWLEAVGDAYLRRSTRVEGRWKEGVARVTPDVGGAGAGGLTARAEVFDGAKRVGWAEGPAVAPLEIPVPAPKPWAPGSPSLYTLRLTLRDGKRVLDRARSQFGFRDIAIDGRRVLLNGRPLYQKLVLDQRFYPDGVYTAPSDRAIAHDIRLAMNAGFNGARVHQKPDDPRYYYWADRLGFLLWDEMADWGLDLALARNRDTLEAEWVEVVRRDWNHPSVIAWTPLNERRGDFLEDKAQQDFAERLHDLTRRLDPTRPAIDNDGYCHVKSDLATIHDYSLPEPLRQTWAEFGRSDSPKAFPAKVHQPHYVPGRAYGGEPVILSEVAGVWYSEDGETQGWGYGGKPASREEYVRRYRDTLWAIMDLKEVAGFCVTQFTDVEQEQNGVYYDDRSEKLPPEVFAAIHAGPRKWKRHRGARSLREAAGEDKPPRPSGEA
ncbi:MAG TPA: glycoside hydrolase family 2 TIM barrel-domain containing protein, partial [Candidatus Brocadiia bacterium]|nr:glycoside hydrolase family 2 TIM barrel-domain containing protein [Candidatus Brocadiia bacterium]